MRAWRVDTEMIVCERRCHTPARSAIEEADLNQIGFDDFFY